MKWANLSGGIENHGALAPNVLFPNPETQQQCQAETVNQRLAEIGLYQPEKMHDAAYADEVDQAVQ